MKCPDLDMNNPNANWMIITKLHFHLIPLDVDKRDLIPFCLIQDKVQKFRENPGGKKFCDVEAISNVLKCPILPYCARLDSQVGYHCGYHELLFSCRKICPWEMMIFSIKKCQDTV